MARTRGNSSEPALFESVVFSESELAQLSTSVLVGRLVARGFSRLTAERFVAIRQGTVESGRARSHPVSRR